MSVIRLPTTLEQEPLVDALFELRFGGELQMADILPGILFGQLEPRPTLQRLPTADIPQGLRASDPNLQYASLIRLDWTSFYILFGDRSLSVSCKLPYPKWPHFKAAILDIVQRVAAVGISAAVERFSLKYTNVIGGDTIGDQVSKINLAIRIGDVEAKDDHFTIQLHHNEGGILHIISVLAGAVGQTANGNQVYGSVVDVDSIQMVDGRDLSEFISTLEQDVEKLRIANKAKFFACLTPQAIEDMGPTYV